MYQDTKQQPHWDKNQNQSSTPSQPPKGESRDERQQKVEGKAQQQPHQPPAPQQAPQQQQQQPPIAPGNGVYHYPPQYQYPPPPNMALHHPPPYYGHPHHPQYMPPAMYQQAPPHQHHAPPPPEAYRSPAAQPGQGSGQSAPRQRTAIACKYCRRRKIRCSGFEASEDGRCSNCARFNQECIFTPVSAQAQAFVPAQALNYARVGGGRGVAGQPQFFGPYGNPYPQPYPQSYPMAAYANGPPPPPQSFSEQPPQQAGRRRTHEEAHTPTLPPPNPGPNAELNRTQHPGNYPDPSNYHSAYPPPPNYYPGHAQYYAQQPPPNMGQQAAAGTRNSPGSAYSYEASRASSSPHTQYPAGYPPNQQGTPSQAPPPQPQTQYSGVPVSGPPANGQAPAGRSPTQAGSERGARGLSIHDMVEGGNGQSGNHTNGNGATSNGNGRSAADSSMVSALDRPPPKR